MTECVAEVRALKNIEVAFVAERVPLQRMTPAAARMRQGVRAEIVYPYPRPSAARMANPRATAEGPADGLTIAQSLQAFRDALRGSPIEVRDGRWYPTQVP